MSPVDIDAELMVTATRSGLEVDFDKNPTKLYDAICACVWDVALRIVKEHPEQAQTWVVRHHQGEGQGEEEQEILWRFLPLHSACARQPPSTLISALLKAYPEAASCEDDQGMYPLHYACGNQAAPGVIKLLLEHNPEATGKADPHGMLPIHYLACWGPSSVSVVDMVLAANEDMYAAKDEDGNTPLDLALEGEYPDRDAVVSTLSGWHIKKLGTTKKSLSVDVGVGVAETSNAPGENSEPNSPKKSSSRFFSKDIVPVLATPRTVTRLRHDLNKKASEQQQREASWRKKSRQQTSTMQTRYEELKEEFDNLAMELEMMKEQLSDTEAQRESSHTELLKAKEQLAKVNTEWETKMLEMKREMESVLVKKEAEWESKTAELLATQEKLEAETVEEKEADKEENVLQKEGLNDDAQEMAEAAATKEAELTAANAELQQKLLEQKAEFESQLAAKEAELERTTEALTSQLALKDTTYSSKLESLTSTETDLSDMMKVLKESQDECTALQASLDEVTKEREVYKSKASMMSDRLGSLSASLASMMEVQERVIAKAKVRSNDIAESSRKRREQLNLLLLDDDEEESVLLESCEQDVKSFDRQTKEMTAISALIDVMRK